VVIPVPSSAETTTWFAQLAWVDGAAARDVLVTAEGSAITRVEVGGDPVAGTTRLPGAVIPGLANAHSHAFHRVLRGRVETHGADFWGWRDQMYAVADQVDPDSYHRLARATYAEMTLNGYTTVGEFHYLHHRPGGRPHSERNAMGHALVAAAQDVGVRLTLIDTCYLQGGIAGEELDGVQRRFSDGDADSWVERVSEHRPPEGARIAAGIHSVRAVPPRAMEVVSGWAADGGAPLHLHLSEQPAENEVCLEATGRTPTQLVADHGVLGERTTVVHATHLASEDVGRLGRTGTTACLCPTTERALADGIGPASALRAAGSDLALGSDSHAIIDPFVEARSVELHERLVSGRRGHHRPEDLLHAATAGGMASLGWDAGRIAPGQRCDLVALDTSSVRLAGTDDDALAAHVVHAASGADVTDVVIDARHVVRDGEHVLGDVAAELDAAIREVTRGSS
jgi:formiminoglutamate deiminase